MEALLEMILIILGCMLAFFLTILIVMFKEDIFTSENRYKITTPLCKGAMFFRCKSWSDGGEHNPKTCEFCNKYDGWKKQQDADERKLVKDLAIQYNAKEIRSNDIMLQYGYDMHSKVMRKASKLSSSNITEVQVIGGTRYERDMRGLWTITEEET